MNTIAFSRITRIYATLKHSNRTYSNLAAGVHMIYNVLNVKNGYSELLRF